MIRRPIVFAAALALLAGPALAKDFTYRNARFGTTATFPKEAFSEVQPAPTNGDGLAWRSGSGAELYIYARNNLGAESPSSILSDRKSADRVTYSRQGSRWLVVSGYRDGKIFYERYIFRGDVIHSVAIFYPEDDRATYDRLVGPITSTLTVSPAS